MGLPEILTHDPLDYRNITSKKMYELTRCAYRFYLWEDWLTDSVTGSDNTLVATANNGSVTKYAITDGSATGAVVMSTLGRSDSAPIIRAESTGLTLFGKAKVIFCCRVRIPVLATSAQNFTVRLGFGDSITAAADTDGIFLKYSFASPYWQCVTSASGVATTLTTTKTVPADEWITVAIAYDSSPGAVDSPVMFYAGASLDTMTQIGSIATNLPLAANQTFGLMIRLNKTSGTTSRTLIVDYVEMFGELSNFR